MGTAFEQKWGRPLERAGYTQISNLLLRRWREIGLSRTERDNLLIIISYQDNHETIPSAKQLAYESGVCYETTRKNLKHLTAYKKDGGLGLLIPVLLKQGRTRYNLMPLRRELEKLEQSPALEIVKPAKVRPAPKPAPEPVILAEYQPDRDAAYQKAWQEPDDDAIASWEEIKAELKEEIPAPAYDTWIASTRGIYWDNGDTLVVSVLSTGHQDVLERWRDLIKRCSRRLFGNISIAFKVLAAAALPI